ncbi:hypothetical protein CEXT_783251 [Caerostris extrusa]|uniref:Uncharacterized protein n=1 Tax=Caerostris extrusa TaxID=172846 RepID=A0AAV4XZM4_CAEEX|nr:hypothetical protein CEXT_783251 [Caerostris extrusa]
MFQLMDMSNPSCLTESSAVTSTSQCQKGLLPPRTMRCVPSQFKFGPPPKVSWRNGFVALQQQPRCVILEEFMLGIKFRLRAEDKCDFQLYRGGGIHQRGERREVRVLVQSLEKAEINFTVLPIPSCYEGNLKLPDNTDSFHCNANHWCDARRIHVEH